MRPQREGQSGSEKYINDDADGIRDSVKDDITLIEFQHLRFSTLTSSARQALDPRPSTFGTRLKSPRKIGSIADNINQMVDSINIEYLIDKPLFLDTFGSSDSAVSL